MADLIVAHLDRVMPLPTHTNAVSRAMVLELITQDIHTVEPTSGRLQCATEAPTVAVDCVCSDTRTQGRIAQCDMCRKRQHSSCVVESHTSGVVCEEGDLEKHATSVNAQVLDRRADKESSVAEASLAEVVIEMPQASDSMEPDYGEAEIIRPHSCDNDPMMEWVTSGRGDPISLGEIKPIFTSEVPDATSAQRRLEVTTTASACPPMVPPADDQTVGLLGANSTEAPTSCMELDSVVVVGHQVDHQGSTVTPSPPQPDTRAVDKELHELPNPSPTRHHEREECTELPILTSSKWRISDSSSSEISDPVAFVWQMHQACDEDDELALACFTSERPSSRQNLVFEVAKWHGAPRERLLELLDCNFLSAARRWLQCGVDRWDSEGDQQNVVLALLQYLRSVVSRADLERSGNLLRVIRRCGSHADAPKETRMVCHELNRVWTALLPEKEGSGAKVAAPPKRPPSSEEQPESQPSKRIRFEDGTTPLLLPAESFSGGESVSSSSGQSPLRTPSSQHNKGKALASQSRRHKLKASTPTEKTSANCKRTIAAMVKTKLSDSGLLASLSQTESKHVLQTATRELASLVKAQHPEEYSCVPFIMPLKLALKFHSLVEVKIARLTKRLREA